MNIKKITQNDNDEKILNNNDKKTLNNNDKMTLNNNDKKTLNDLFIDNKVAKKKLLLIQKII
jgi:hypothetical protein